MTIALLLMLAVIGFMFLREKPPERITFNPEPVTIPQDLINKDGNVLWINLANIRPDHIGVYGYDNATTPSIDSLAGQSLVFERCYAQSTEVYRSMATMMTSKYPVCYVGSTERSEGMGFRELVVNPRPTLIEKIRESGKTTCAVVSSLKLKGIFGFAEGFDYYNDDPVANPDGSFRARTSAETFNESESWLSRNFRRPFFMMVQFPDPGGPYQAAPEFMRQLRNMDAYSDERVIPVATDDKHLHNQIPAYHKMSDEIPAVGEMIKRYDAEIAEVDYYVGRLLDTLVRLEINDDTMVIISGHNGEALGEHGLYFTHGNHVYRCLSHIPLIINLPNGGSGRISATVEGIDIMPTVISWLGIKPDDDISGMNLLRFFTKPKLKRSYPAFCYWDSPPIYSVIKGNYELINFANKEYRLYHIINDPDEIYDLYSDDDPVASELKQYLDAWIKVNHQRALDVEIKRGYTPSGHRQPVALPNPDDVTSR